MLTIYQHRTLGGDRCDRPSDGQQDQQRRSDEDDGAAATHVLVDLKTGSRWWARQVSNLRPLAC